MFKVFVSYRRSDSADAVGRAFEHLSRRFGRDTLFIDVASIPLGNDIRKTITNAIEQSTVVLVFIGKDWLSSTDNLGNRRIDHPDDYVKLEIEAALRESKVILPILLHGHAMPDSQDLPSSIRQLAFQNAAALRTDPDFTADIERISKQLAKYRRQSTATFTPSRILKTMLVVCAAASLSALVIWIVVTPSDAWEKTNTQMQENPGARPQLVTDQSGTSPATLSRHSCKKIEQREFTYFADTTPGAASRRVWRCHELELDSWNNVTIFDLDLTFASPLKGGATIEEVQIALEEYRPLPEPAMREMMTRVEPVCFDEVDFEFRATVDTTSEGKSILAPLTRHRGFDASEFKVIRLTDSPTSLRVDADIRREGYFRFSCSLKLRTPNSAETVKADLETTICVVKKRPA